MTGGEATSSSLWTRLKDYLGRSPIPRSLFWAAAILGYFAPPIAYLATGRATRGVAVMIAACALYIASAIALQSLGLFEAPYAVLARYGLPMALQVCVAIDVGLLVLLGRARCAPRGWSAIKSSVPPVGLWLGALIVFHVSPLDGSFVPIRKTCVQTQSMEPLLDPRECYLVTEVSRYTRGDVVKYREGESSIHRYGRVIGLVGDKVAFSSGVFTVNGQAFDRAPMPTLPDQDRLSWKLNDKSRLIRETNSDGLSYDVLELNGGAGPDAAAVELVVPPGALFLAGDARDVSSDSRKRGAWPIDQVQGKVVMIFASPTAARRLTPVEPWTRTP